MWKEPKDVMRLIDDGPNKIWIHPNLPDCLASSEMYGTTVLVNTVGDIYAHFIKAPVQYDLSGYKGRGKVHLMLWVEDAKKCPQGCVEFTTSEWWDEHEYEYLFNFTPDKIQTGWNSLVFDLSDFVPHGRPDWSNIRFIRVWVENQEPLTSKLADFYLFKN